MCFYRVTLGNLNNFLSTSCVTNLSFLGSQEIGMPDSKFPINSIFLIFIKKLYFLELNSEVEQYLNQHTIKSFSNQSTLLTNMPSKPNKMKRKMSVKGAIKKTRSFMLDGNNKYI